MISSLQPARSRFLALLLLIVSVLALCALIAIPAWSLNNHYDQLIENMQNQLEIYQRVATHSDQYQAEYQRLLRQQGQDRRYLQSDTESLATAELQRAVKQVIAGKNGEIISTQVAQTVEEEGFKRVAIRIRMKSTLEDMVAIFHAIESQKPYLFIDDINVRSRQVARRRMPANQELQDALSQLEIDFQLSGYMRGSRS